MRAGCWVAWLAVIAGCGPSVPTFPIYGHDAGLECGDELGDCPSGQICLQGYCYAECSDTRPCGPREECSSEGICVALTHDAGPPPDGGPPDPCESVTCDAPTPFCRAGVCVSCVENNATPPQCGGGTPICDLGRGLCVAFAPAVCGPCASDFDCAGTPIATSCTARTGPPAEQVCLPMATGGSCPAGFAAEGPVCIPILGTCTGVLAAASRRSCAADADCGPVGADASTGVFTRACFDDDGDKVATCHHPCAGGAAPIPCPAGLTCDETLSFCR